MMLPHHPVAVVGDVVAGAAAIVAISGYLHEGLSIIVLVMGAAWYAIQFKAWWNKRDGA